MANGVNKVFLIGHLGQNPKAFSYQGGELVKISIATTQKWRDKQNNLQSDTSWHNVTLFGRLGEIALQYLTKGSLVCIEGALKYSKYEKEGQEHHKTEIVAASMQMLGGGGTRPQQADNLTPKSQTLEQIANDFDDDEIPF